MEFAVMLNHERLLDSLLKKEIQAVIVGVDKLSHRMETTFPLDEIEIFVKRIHNQNKKILLNMNALLHHPQLPLLEESFANINELNIDGILFADLAVYQAAKRYNLEDKLIYYPETYLTSNEDVRFWQGENIQSVVLGRELTLNDIEMIGKDKALPLVLVGHGYLNMFHSRRPLVENFLKFTNDEHPEDLKDKKNLTIVEEIRDEAYPIVQDDFGTHVFRAKPLASFKALERLKPIIDMFIIDTLFFKDEAILTTVDDYLNFAQKADESIIKKYEATHDEGFYHKRTIYLEKGGES